MRQGLFIHALAGVRGSEEHIITGCGSKMSVTVFLIQGNIFGFDEQFSSFRYGIPCVDSKIHHHLLYLRRICIDGAHFYPQGGVQS